MFEVDLELIKNTRHQRGYSLQDMADKMGFNNKTKYYRRENGEYNFKSEEIPLLSKILGISISKIFIQKVSKIETKELEATL